MKLSKIISEYVDLKIQGEPDSREYSSFDRNRARREDYWQELTDLEAAIDEIVDRLEAA